jgi:hypothetical protein
MHYVFGYFVVCIAVVVWIRYAAERVPVADVTVE